MGAKTSAKVGFKPCPPESDSITSTEVLTTRLSGPCHRLSSKLYFGVRAIEITQHQEVREKVTWEVKDHSRKAQKRSSEKSA